MRSAHRNARVPLGRLGGCAPTRARCSRRRRIRVSEDCRSARNGPPRRMSRAPRKLAGIENRRHRRRDGRGVVDVPRPLDGPAHRPRLSRGVRRPAGCRRLPRSPAASPSAGACCRARHGPRPLAEFTAEWWKRYAGLNLERSTLRTYAVVWNRHCCRASATCELRQLTPGAVARLRADLESDGVGPATIRKALGLLQAIAARPSSGRSCTLTRSSRSASRPRRASSRSAHSGRRRSRRCAAHVPRSSGASWSACSPTRDCGLEEARGLRSDTSAGRRCWSSRRTSAARSRRPQDRAPAALGELLEPLRRDLAAHRLARGRPGDQALLFARSGRRAVARDRLPQLARRDFQAGAGAGGPDIRRPYDLRHAFASLLLHEGRSLVYVAEQLGHTVATLSADRRARRRRAAPPAAAARRRGDRARPRRRPASGIRRRAPPRLTTSLAT